MSRNRNTFLLTLSHDPVPGANNTVADTLFACRSLVEKAWPHYQPTVDDTTLTAVEIRDMANKLERYITSYYVGFEDANGPSIDDVIQVQAALVSLARELNNHPIPF